jgi:hypothetical protein
MAQLFLAGYLEECEEYYLHFVDSVDMPEVKQVLAVFAKERFLAAVSG